LYRQRLYADALESFKEVDRVLHPQRGGYRDDGLREKAFMQLARILYEHKQFKNALFYYSRINRDSRVWLESLFESSWASFRLGEHQKALGNLLTLDSPYFQDEYFPEALILKAVTYFENCRYPESSKIAREFRRRYEPLLGKLRGLLRQVESPKDLYRRLLAMQRYTGRNSQTGRMFQRILNLVLGDEDVNLVNTSILQHQKEILKIERIRSGFADSTIARALTKRLQLRKEELIGRAGRLARKRLEQERNSLKDLTGQALRIELANQIAQKQILEEVGKEGEPTTPVLVPYPEMAAVGDEQLYWPFQGEYWEDELGTYNYVLTYGCRSQRGGD
jgi:tetratricopeptide (TPR) repeat protein